MTLLVWHLISSALVTCLVLEAVMGQNSIELKSTYRCERIYNGRLHLHFRAYDVNGLATEMGPVDANGDPWTGGTCVPSGVGIMPYVVDTYVDLTNKIEVDNSCGVEVAGPNAAVQIYRWRFQARRVDGGRAIGTKYTMIAECPSNDLDNQYVSTVVLIDVPGLGIDPVNELNKIGTNGVQKGSQTKYTGLFYPGQEDIPGIENPVGTFYYSCYAGLNSNNVRLTGVRVVDENGCRIPTAAYAPTTEFELTSASGVSPQVIAAQGPFVQQVGTLCINCLRGFCNMADECCRKKCGCTSNNIVPTQETHQDCIEVKDELAQDYFATDALTPPPPLGKISLGEDGDMVYYVAKLTPGGAGTDQDLMSAMGMAVYNCRASTNPNFPPGLTTQYVDDNGCVIPGTDFSPNAEFMLNTDLSGANEYYITSGMVTLKQQMKYTVYHRCDTLICKTENHDTCRKLCGATDMTNTEKLGYKGLHWQIDIKASPRLSVEPVDEMNKLGEDGVQVGADLTLTGHFYPNDDPATPNAVGMYYVNCLSATNQQFTTDVTQFIDANGCVISDAPFAPTSGFMPTSVAGEIPITTEATGSVAQYLGGKDGVYIRCRRRYCVTTDDPCCTNTACSQECNPATTILSNTYDTDFIRIRNDLAQRMLGTNSLTHPLLATYYAVEGDEIYFVSQHIPGGINTDDDLKQAKGFYVYNCRYSTNQAVPVDQSTLFVGPDGCIVDSDFAPAAEFFYDSNLSGTNEYYIRSGLVKLKTQNKYKVYFRCETGICLTEDHPRCSNRRCGATGANVNIDYRELGYKGLNFAISIKKSNRFEIAPEDPVDWRGSSTVIANADLKYTAYFYPGEDILPDAVGYYYHSCYVGTNEGVTRDRQQYIDGSGCPIAGAPFAPTAFVRTSVGGEVPFILMATGARAQLLNGRNTIFSSCKLGYCTSETDPCCLTGRCGRTCTSATDTNSEHTGSITVIEAEPSLRLVGSTQIATDPTLTETYSGIAGTNIYLAAKLVPQGTESDALMQTAKGFFLYSCRHDNNPNVPDHRATYIVNDNGCVIGNAALSPAADFELNDALSNDYSYTLTSGSVTLVDQPGYRTYFKCKVCICTTENNPVCRKRCGNQVDNSVRCLDGDITYNIGIIKNTDPPLALTLTSRDGTADLTTAGGVVGEAVSFGAIIQPAKGGGALSGAQGAYVKSCFATTFQGDIADIPESQKSYFIDATGCKIAGSDFETNQECKAINTDTELIQIDCGQFTIKRAGNWRQLCDVGVCEEPHTLCEQRCQPGVAVPATVRDTTTQIASEFTATEPATTPGRTAIVSEEKRALIIALTTIIPSCIILGVAIGVCLLVRSQNGKRV